MLSHTRQQHAMTKSCTVLTTHPTKTCHNHRHVPSFKDVYLHELLKYPRHFCNTSPWSLLLSGGRVASFLSVSPTYTLWHHTLQLSDSLWKVESSWSNQSTSSPPELPCSTQCPTMTPTACGCHTAPSYPVSDAITQSHPTQPTLMLEEDRWVLAFPGMCGEYCHSLPRALNTDRPGLTPSSPLAASPNPAAHMGKPRATSHLQEPWGSSKAEGGCVGSCSLTPSGGSLGLPGPKAQVYVCDLAPSLPASPSCSEPGANSASQDTSLQSACEGGPLPRSCVPLQADPRPIHLWASLWTPPSPSGQTTLQFWPQLT
jgi:hypothetical protein